MSGPSLSQVLLTDDRWRHRLTATVPEAEFGIEWAAGRGSLTELLLDRWSYLLALELDASFCRDLRGQFPVESLGVVRANILEYPLPVRETTYPLVGNLPYHLTGPLLVNIARCADRISGFYGLVQKEVAARVAAGPGESDYRSISVLMQWCFEVEWTDTVPAAAFSPQPDVDSGWIRLVPRPRERPFEPVRGFLEQCFQQPRKTLVNNLADTTESKQRWRRWFEDRDWDSRRRPHSLSLDEFLEVFDAWNEQSF